MNTTKANSNHSEEQNVHSKCATLFDKLFETKDGNSVGCDIWRALVGDPLCYENCIGENFNQLLESIRDDWFKHPEFAETSTSFYNTTYITWLYYVVARVYEVLDTIDPTRTDARIQKCRKAFTAFAEVNLWAKFFKHPKEFFFTHWAKVGCEGEQIEAGEGAIRVDSAYLKRHYTAGRSPRPAELKNNTEVIVEYPDLPRLTEDFVRDFLAFRDLVCNDEQIINALKQDTNALVDSGTQDLGSERS